MPSASEKKTNTNKLLEALKAWHDDVKNMLDNSESRPSFFEAHQSPFAKSYLQVTHYLKSDNTNTKEALQAASKYLKSIQGVINQSKKDKTFSSTNTEWSPSRQHHYFTSRINLLITRFDTTDSLEKSCSPCTLI